LEQKLETNHQKIRGTLEEVALVEKQRGEVVELVTVGEVGVGELLEALAGKGSRLPL